MTRRFQLLVLCAALATPLTVRPAVGETPTVADILARHAEALGGAERAQARSLKITGSFNFNGIDSPYTLYRLRPNLFRVEIEASIGTVVTAFDGETAWTRSPDRSGEMRVRKMEGEDRQNLLDETADFDDPLVDCEKKGHRVELVGEEDVDGVAAYHLKLTLASGNVQEWFLSQDDHQAVRRVTTAVHRRAGPYPRVYYLMEHQRTAGVSLPFYVEREDRQHVRAYTVEKVEVDAEIDPALFAMPEPTPEARIQAVLDDFHAAAAAADEERYFGHLGPGAVFLGTDASERWTKEEFRAYAHPHFARGQGWTYRATSRHVTVTGETAWFDEALQNDSYGECRGSGVLRLHDGAWKIEHYNLTIPIPNELAKDFVARIRELGSGEQ